MKKHLKRVVYGLSTILGIRRYGFFIPYRYARSTVSSVGHYAWIRDEFVRRCESEFIDILQDIKSFEGELASLTGPPPVPRWNQDWFPGLDAAVAYALVRTRRPGKILEIGSGHSTRFLMRAVRDEGLGTRMTCVDPAPRADIGGLGVDLLRNPVQTVPVESLPQLESGDFLFVDSSHIAMSGGDVDWILNVLIQGLPVGVYVHFHDIFLPDTYPESWAWRNYNEQIVVAALLAGKRLKPIFSSHFVRTHRPDLVESNGLGWISLVAGAIESSLWLETV